MNNILNKNQIVSIKTCGKILSESLFEVEKNVKPGVTTQFLDEIAEREIRNRGGVPSFLNYEVLGIGRFPNSLCISINDEVVHGIPSSKRFLEEGDIVSLDLGVKYQNVCTDMATTVPVGNISNEAQRLLDITKLSLIKAIEAVKVGKRIGVIGETVQKIAEREGYGVVRDLVGHGIGTKPHMDPPIPNYGRSTDGPVIQEGMALAIEPMLTIGSYKIYCKNDRWTILTKDGSLAAHFEHTVVIENGSPTIVTK